MSRSYEFKTPEKPTESVNAALLRQFGLEGEHRNELLKRGLSANAIANAEYVSKPANNSKSANAALKYMIENFNLDEVPGFYIDDRSGHRQMVPTAGVIIPSRGLDGGTRSLSIRANNPKKSKSGKVIGKYIHFSSGGKTRGGTVTLGTHCPVVKGLPKKSCSVTARITEGILKADVATFLDDTYCLGMHGLNIPDDLGSVIEALEISTLHIALDAGEDENIDMIKAIAGLVRLCRKIGIDYVVEKWSPEYGKGIDDVLKSGHADKIRHATEDEISNILSLARHLDPFNGEWVYAIAPEAVVNIHTGQQLRKQQFIDKMRLVKGDLVSVFLSEGRIAHVDDLTFWPGKGLYIEDNGQRFLNQWRDPLVPCSPGDVSVFLDHVAFVFQSEREQNILLDVIAFMIQYPGEKIHWMLIIVGKAGIGKSYFQYVLQLQLGAKNISLPSNDQIREQYSGWQKNCQLVIVEELMGSDRRDLVNKLKPWITQRETVIREMHREGYVHPNRFNMIAFTNHENALPIDQDDRRFCVLQSLVLPKDEEYYERLFSWTAMPENIAALSYYLKNRDLKKFNAKGHAPMTDAKSLMIGLSIDPFEEWVKNGLEQGLYPFDRDVAPLAHLKRNAPFNYGKRSDAQWLSYLKKYGAINYPTQVPIGSGRVKCWLLRENKHLLLNYGPTEIGRIYQESPLIENGQDPSDIIREDKPF